MGYTYPELANNPSNETLVASIKAQYSGPANVSVPVVSTERAIKRQSSSSIEKTIYLAETKLPTYGLQDGEGSASAYSVLIFLGGVGTDAATWAISDSLVSTAGTLGGQMQSDQVAVSTIDLSRALEKAIDSGQTTFEKAEQFLKKNLSWRIELVSFSSGACVVQHANTGTGWYRNTKESGTEHQSRFAKYEGRGRSI
jgi:tyrosinase